jgi:DNA repair protein RadC
MNQQGALKLLEISVNLASNTLHTKATTEGSNAITQQEIQKTFSACVDMVSEKFQALPITEQNADEKFATIGEMHRIFAEKFAQIDQKDEKFATISEMHKIFAEKFAQIDQKDEKFASIAEMHKIFAEKFAELDREKERFATIAEMHRVFAEKFAALDREHEKFATIAEMHRIFAEKFADYDRKLATLMPQHRTSRRPV